jgi:hypothetical protein
VIWSFRNLESFFGDKKSPTGPDEGPGLSNTWTIKKAVAPQGLQGSKVYWTDR